MGHKELREHEKAFKRCYTIALKFWDEFNANFVLFYFPSPASIKTLTTLLQKCEEKK